MYQWYPVHPEYRTYLDQALQGRAEAQGRAVYLAIVGVESAVGFLARTVAGGLRAVGAAVTHWQRRRLTVQALSRLDERMLRDVGISASDIDWVAEELSHATAPKSVADLATARLPAVPRMRLDLDCPQMRFAA